MAYQLVLTDPTPSEIPADGIYVGYRELGSGGSYTVSGPHMSFPITIPTGDPVGTLYEGYITRDCGTLESDQFFWQTPCNCTDSNFSVSPSGLTCEEVETTPPTIESTGGCLAAATNVDYSEYGARIYNTGFIQTTMNLVYGTPDALVYGYTDTATQWHNEPKTTGNGPLNREGVWIDNNCDGTVDQDAVTATISFKYNNATTSNQQMYIGAGADNAFTLTINGSTVANTGTAGDLQFKIWHIMPVTMIPGPNYINIVSQNVGVSAQSVGMVLYNNTPAELSAATSDAQLNILFQTSALRGGAFDIATCEEGWSLDTSGGSGNYICVKTNYMDCNTLE